MPRKATRITQVMPAESGKTGFPGGTEELSAFLQGSK